MRSDFFYESSGVGLIHACRWSPEGQPKAVLQIVHGIAEYAARYEAFAEYMNSLGYLVVAEDHMGHGESVNGGGIRGYFHGGWFRAVNDTGHLMTIIHAEYPDIPYVLFGHSMGSFMARTLLSGQLASNLSAAVICGTGWQPQLLLPAAVKLCEYFCGKTGEENPSDQLQNLVFGGYNKRITAPRTPYDWLSRDEKVVDAYMRDPMCGFTASTGLLRDMLKGISYVEDADSLLRIPRNLPVFFIAGSDDPVGSYGKGVLQAARAFERAGVKDVSCRLYSGGRHEILNETNRQEVYRDISEWLSGKICYEKSAT